MFIDFLFKNLEFYFDKSKLKSLSYFKLLIPTPKDNKFASVKFVLLQKKTKYEY